MRVSLPFILLAAGVASQSVSDAFASLPLCGQSCLTPILQSTNCNITTLPQLSQCLCLSVQTERKISACLQATCNSTDQYVVSKASQSLCAGYPVPSKGPQLVATIVSLSAIAIPMILLRVLWRLFYTKLWWDDVMILFSGVFLTGQLVMVILVVEKGFGKHLWNIDLRESTDLLKIYYVMQVLYVIIQKLVKLSILVSYLRIFPETIRWFRISIYVTIGFSAGHGMLITLLTAFQCLPVSSIWNISITGKCIDIKSIIYAGTAFSIVDDLLIMTLPIPCFSSLRMGRLKKISIGMMFTIGSLSCIATSIRLKYVSSYGGLADSTWDNVETTMSPEPRVMSGAKWCSATGSLFLILIRWAGSTVEIFTAAIGACLPALRQILQRVFPKSVGVTYHSSNMSRGNSYRNIDRKFGSSNASSRQKNVNESGRPAVSSSGDDDGIAEAVHARRSSGDLEGTELAFVPPRRPSVVLKGAVMSTKGVD